MVPCSQIPKRLEQFCLWSAEGSSGQDSLPGWTHTHTHTHTHTLTHHEDPPRELLGPLTLKGPPTQIISPQSLETAVNTEENQALKTEFQIHLCHLPAVGCVQPLRPPYLGFLTCKMGSVIPTFPECGEGTVNRGML